MKVINHSSLRGDISCDSIPSGLKLISYGTLIPYSCYFTTISSLSSPNLIFSLLNLYLMSLFKLFLSISDILSSSASLVLLLFLHCYSNAAALTLLVFIDSSRLVDRVLRLSSVIVDFEISSLTLATTASKLLLNVVFT